jgi:hypothetical protein
MLARDVGNNGVPAGYLAFNVASVVDTDAEPRWAMIDLRDDPDKALAAKQQDLLVFCN